MSLRIQFCTISVSVLLVGTAGISNAQDTTSIPPAAPGKEISSSLKRSGKLLETIGKKPLHPVIKGVASSGGPGIGLGFDAPIRLPWEFDADAVITMRKYTSVTAIAGYHERRIDAEVYGRTRDMLELPYYGPGNNARKGDRTDFRLKENFVGAVTGFDLASWLRIGARGERYWPEFSTGKSESTPNMEGFFGDDVAPGQLAKPVYWRYQGSAQFMLNPGEGESLQQGTTLRATYDYFDDRELNLFSFRRVDLELQQRIAMFKPFHRLTLHALASGTKALANQSVPFYQLPSLGGKGKLRSVHEDIIGTDGSEATLRGYSSFQFRDQNLLLMQAEYRMPLMGPFEGTVFFDAGKVAASRNDLDFRNLHNDVGVSLNLMKGTSTMLRADVARGTQGFYLLLSIGRDIVP